MQEIKQTLRGLVFASLTLALVGVVPFSAIAGHNGAVVTNEVLECGETTFTATITDPDGTHKVSNMWLVVSANGATQSMNIPIDGSDATITVGPFFDDTTISWNVFGGAERSYDQPLWNGFGGATFGADINAYAAEQGGFSWVLDGPEDPNPFTNFNEVNVEGCPLTKDECKDNGWAALGFPNQGQCIQYVNTGK